MREPLPISFRVSPTPAKNQVLCKLFSAPDCISQVIKILPQVIKEPWAENPPKQESKLFAIKKLDFYPDNLLYELGLSRHELKRSDDESFKFFHKFVQICNECGLINRQEVVSMLPPLLLDVKPGMKVLDMCASPGSKTSQLLEKALGDYTTQNDLKSEVTKTGMVIANDKDSQRAFMLTHQLQRFDTASMIVLNKDGQNFPALYYPSNQTGAQSYDSRYAFDRILCDVPCSSDAAIRKIPLKWKHWGTGDAFGLHPLQTRLLIRSLQLVKVGGMVCY
jgi:multisite-specific tRNA:(cytosine-C5)-methyltransferase